MKTNRTGLILIALLLSAGLFLYLTSRPETLFLNHLVAALTAGLSLEFTNSLTHLPAWVIFSLPDGLWMAALVSFILIIWNFRLHKASITWLIIALFAAILYESLQSSHVLPGTFDPMDLVFIIMGCSFPIFLIMVNQYICKAK